MKAAYIFILLCCLFLKISGQNTIGLPDITNFSKTGYQAGTQNWDIHQDRAGNLYFGNNEGLLTFNGNYWKLYPLPNKTVVRSVHIEDNGRVYVGGQGAIGYFFPAKNGLLEFHSLKELIPKEDREFEDVWDIVKTKEGILFRTKNKIFLYKQNKIEAIKAINEWSFLGSVGTKVIAQDFKRGVFIYDNGNWIPLTFPNPPSDLIITSVLPGDNNGFLVTTLKNGLYYYDGVNLVPKQTPIDAELKLKRIYSAVASSTGLIALGTSFGGCMVVDRTGELIQRFSSEDGLLNNNILSLFIDRDNNLWMGLDNGISFVPFNASITHIYPDQKNEGTGYAAKVFRDKLYLGTNHGLFAIPLVFDNADFSYIKGKFFPVTKTEGQVWSLSVVNDKLLLGHHEGAFEVQNFESLPCLNKEGTWLFQSAPRSPQNSPIISGTYNGLTVFKELNGKLINEGHIAGLNESSRFVATGNDNIIWVSHPYRGVYKAKINADEKSAEVRLYNGKDGLPSDVNNHIYKIKNKVVVATERGVYEYNGSSDRFEPSPSFTSLFGPMNVRYLNEDNNGNIWFITGKQVGVVDFSIKSPSQRSPLIYFPELTGRIVSGFENIYPYNDENVFIGSENGFYHLNYKKYRQSSADFKIGLYEVKAIGKKDSLIFGGKFVSRQEVVENQPKKEYVSLSHDWNSFRFVFSSTCYRQINTIEYSYKLEGLDNSWSSWTRKTEKEYTNLSAGTYTFSVKAKNNLGTETKPISYTFKIEAPWYQTVWAYLFYFGVFCFLVWRLHKYQESQLKKQKLRFEEEQKRVQYLYELELDRTEKEIIKLKNEKLEGEIQHKNKELAAATMHLVQKSGLMAKMKEEMKGALKTVDGTQVGELKKVIKMMNADAKFDENWEQFSQHFDKVHEDFLLKLKAIYPHLTSTDLKLCAYLRINLSTKEIAQLLNISIRGVEISRYRLRKKLSIPTETNLYDFLINAVKSKDQ